MMQVKTGAWTSPVTLLAPWWFVIALYLVIRVSTTLVALHSYTKHSPRVTKTTDITAASEEYELEETASQRLGTDSAAVSPSKQSPLNIPAGRLQKLKMDIMDKLRGILQKQDGERGSVSRRTEYEALVAHDNEDGESSESTIHGGVAADTPFYWLEYAVFLLLGVAMLWAWNMFLAAAPYFAARFSSNTWISTNYQSSIISISTLANLASTLILANLQSHASYPFRIATALLIDVVAFTILALSTVLITDISAPVYFVFVLTTVFITSTATGMLQNGTFAFAASFGHPSYTQAVMTGQAIAGVLPSIAQIVSVLAVPEKTTTKQNDKEAENVRATSALIYFFTATAIALVTLLAFLPLVRRHAQLNAHVHHLPSSVLNNERRSSLPHLSLTRSLSTLPDPSENIRKEISLPHLYRLLPLYSTTIFLTFCTTMFFPVYTAKIVSVHPEAGSPRYLHATAFIPLAFLFWNSGDLLGRLATLLPFSAKFSLRPGLLFILSIVRMGFIPLYLLCNLEGKGAAVASDLFYLLVVQFLFGLTNGWVASSTMIGAAASVGEQEREATGGFMGFNLVAGLTVGSLLSFIAA